MMPSHTPSIAELREIRARACRKLAAAVPRAIKVVTERKTKLEAQIDAGKTLSPRAQRELEKIRGPPEPMKKRPVTRVQGRRQSQAGRGEFCRVPLKKGGRPSKRRAAGRRLKSI